MEVERFDIDITFLGTVPQLLLDPHPEGEWVKYEDACAALQAQQEKLEELQDDYLRLEIVAENATDERDEQREKLEEAVEAWKNEKKTWEDALEVARWEIEEKAAAQRRLGDYERQANAGSAAELRADAKRIAYETAAIILARLQQRDTKGDGG